MTNEEMIKEFETYTDEQKIKAFSLMLLHGDTQRVVIETQKETIRLLEKQISIFEEFIRRGRKMTKETKKILAYEPLYDMFFRTNLNDIKIAMYKVREKIGAGEKVTLYEIGKYLGLIDYECTKHVYFDRETDFDYELMPFITDDDEPYIEIRYLMQPKNDNKKD